MKLLFKDQVTKTLSIKENGRSSNFVTPNFLLGCNAGCANSYCYVRRFGRKFIYRNTNIDQILDVIRQHALSLGPKLTPDQTDDKYWTYDIFCDSDIIYHHKDYDWEKVLQFFIDTSNIKATFATKYVNYKFLKYASDKIRIRFSLMPQNLSDILEPNTSKILQRIKAINKYIEAGFDVHINFSPVVVYDNWLEDYKTLFKLVNDNVVEKSKVFCEVIFLTHHQGLHEFNLSQNRTQIEDLLWKPDLQENKTSQYGGDNVRYKHYMKYSYIEQFKELHSSIIPWCKIRYIF